MNIIGSRIDGRLIHGQVANLWIPKLQIDRVIVVDDKISENQIEKSGLRLATPTGVNLSVLTVDRAIKQLNDERYGEQKLFLVAKSPVTFLRMIEGGVPIKLINVGNMSQTDDTMRITNSINVLESDITCFNKIAELGTKLVSQMVPTVKEEDFMTLLEKNTQGGN